MADKFLRKSKVKTRTCFLQVLNMLPVSRLVIESACTLIKPFGDEFYYYYIEGNEEFACHDKFTKYESFKLGNGSDIYKFIDWNPTYE